MTDDSLEQVVFVTNDTELSRVIEKIKSLNKVKLDESFLPPTVFEYQMINSRIGLERTS